MASILVLGLGNAMRSDDAIGLLIAELLQEVPLPPDVEVWASPAHESTALDLVEDMVGRTKVVILDAVQGGGKPGEVYRFAVGADPMPFRPVTSLHELGLLDVLALARQLEMAPDELIVIGVEPGSLEWGTAITSEVAAALPHMVELVLEETRPQVG